MNALISPAVSRLPGLLVGGVLALAGVGCGTSSEAPSAHASEPAEAMVSNVAAALRGVQSYHIDGTWVDEDGRQRVNGDVAASGSMRFTMTQGRTRAQMVIAGSEVFAKGNGAYWLAHGVSSSSSVARLLTDHWVELLPNAAASVKKSLGGVLPETLAYCLTRDHGTVTMQGSRRFAGRRVVVLADKGDRPGVSPGELYVAATGTPLPLRVIQTGPRSPGKLDPRCGDAASKTTASDVRLSAFDEPVRITAPPGALDLSSLSGATGA